LNAIGQYETTQVLEKALPVLERSHRALANNIANANTPGFSPTRVSFRESLQMALAGAGRRSLALKTTHPRHLAAERPPVELALERDEFAPGRNDRSEFDVDREMVELLKNTGKFEILSTILTKRYQQTREVLRIP
jgi:flagellar basal-body rod protein FlgB